jgi:hypothetical protein
VIYRPPERSRPTGRPQPTRELAGWLVVMALAASLFMTLGGVPGQPDVLSSSPGTPSVGAATPVGSAEPGALDVAGGFLTPPASPTGWPLAAPAFGTPASPGLPTDPGFPSVPWTPTQAVPAFPTTSAPPGFGQPTPAFPTFAPPVVPLPATNPAPVAPAFPTAAPGRGPVLPSSPTPDPGSDGGPWVFSTATPADEGYPRP